MTIPSRPAPAPPGSRAQNAAAGANASLEQLRLQLQQQHMQQQQAGNGLQKLTIKLPPPPKGPLQQQNAGLYKKPQGISSNNNNNNNHCFTDDALTPATSITRKFPQARYTPATSWDDTPFSSGGGSNGNFRKVPPPRPPPPKVQVNARKPTAATTTTTTTTTSSLITNIFQRKKSTATATAAASKAAAQNRVYGLSSGHATTTTTTTASSNMQATQNYNNYDWNAAWNTASSSNSTSTTTNNSAAHYASSAAAAEGQLISFDSPPASPTFTQKSNSDCVSVDSFSSDSNFSSPHNGSVSQPESGFEDDYHARSRPATNSPLDPWETVDKYSLEQASQSIGTAPVRQSQLRQAADNPLCNGKSLLPPTLSLQMPTIIKPKIGQKPKAPKPPAYLCQPPSPPMPQGAPPVLPAAATSSATAGISLLDVITGKVDALALSNGCTGYLEETQVPYAIALYDFEGLEQGDLSFRENEKIYLLEQPTAEWFRGRTRAGCEGIFPSNYVDVKVPLESDSQVQQVQQPQQQQQLPTARCLYHFAGEIEGDLPLQENELVTVLYRINEDWLYGEAAGRQGQFPANFLEVVPDNLPTA